MGLSCRVSYALRVGSQSANFLARRGALQQNGILVFYNPFQGISEVLLVDKGVVPFLCSLVFLFFLSF